MLDSAAVQKEIDTGLSAVCSWCTHYWDARARDGKAVRCSIAGCGGPGKGMAFPRYSGPRSNLASYCFVCGAEAQMAVEFHGSGGGMVGCCNEHEPLLRRILANQKPLVVRERLVPVLSPASGV